MKKFKNYILMLLVPLVLLGCVSKGVSDAVTEDTTNSNLGGYTWAQLGSMINNSQSKYESSRLSNNIENLEYLYTAAIKREKTTAASNINTLIVYLTNNVETPITNMSSTFVYSTAASKVQSLDSTIVENLGIYSYSKTKAIYDKVVSLFANNPRDLTLENIYISLDATVSDITIRSEINPFYAKSWDLYTQYINNIGTYTVYNYDLVKLFCNTP